MIRVGAVLPTRELSVDRDVVRQWLSGAVDIGVDHVVVADHVLGVDPDRRPDWAQTWPHPSSFRGAYTVDDVFHEPFVLLGFLAALCDLELVTGVLILPQRQTALVAKQAAEVDVLSSGRLRLAVGVGWNAAEYDALDVPFTDRGARIEEQVAVLRSLWTQDVVDITGRFHHLVGVGVRPHPVQRPIPIWMGGEAPTVLRRIGRMGDGWYLHARAAPDAETRMQLTKIRQAAEAAGRAPEAIGVEARFRVEGEADRELAATAAGWMELGATHLAVDTMNAGRSRVDDHLGALRRGVQIIRAAASSG